MKTTRRALLMLIAAMALAALPARAEDKPVPQIVLMGIAEGMIAVDVAQSVHFLRTNPDSSENNPLLGSHPSPARMIVSAAAAGVGAALLWKVLPNKLSWLVPAGIIGAELMVIGYNFQAGATFRF